MSIFLVVRRVDDYELHQELLLKLGFKYIFEDVVDAKDIKRILQTSKLKNSVILSIDDEAAVALAYQLGMRRILPGADAIVQLRKTLSYNSEHGYGNVRRIANAVPPDYLFVDAGDREACAYYRSVNLLVCTKLYADDAGHQVFKEVLEFLMSLGDQGDSDTAII